MATCVNSDVCNKSRVYSGTETSEQPSTRQGDNSIGEETYPQYVEFPARWVYAIAMESEKLKVKVKYENIKVKYQNIKDKICQIIKCKFQQINAKYQQIKTKYEQNVCQM